MSRKQARENVFKLIYERCILGQGNPLTLDELCIGFSDSDRAFLNEIYLGTQREFDYLMGIIEHYSGAFKLDRIFKVDLALMLSAVYEILFSKNIPYQIVANEAVELCKTYSTEKSYKFVNGILSSVIRDKDFLIANYPQFIKIDTMSDINNKDCTQ